VVFGLAWFRDRVSLPRLGAGFGLPQYTSYRYLAEVIDVLAGKAPDSGKRWNAPWPRGRRT
jgi:hypothetical protein